MVKNLKVLYLLGSPCPTLDESPMLDSSLQPSMTLYPDTMTRTNWNNSQFSNLMVQFWMSWGNLLSCMSQITTVFSL